MTNREPKKLIRARELKAPPTIKQYRASMRDVRKSVSAMFKSAMPTIQSLINGATDFEGNLVFSQRGRVAQQAGEVIHKLFVADGRNAFAQDGVSALTPYADILNRFYVRVTMEAIYAQNAWMRKNLPEDLFRWLSRQQFTLRLSEAENPFLRKDGEDDDAFLKRMEDLRVFHPNPLAELDPNRRWVPMHKWTTPDGYELSQRIWNTANDTRSKIDAFIMKAFAEGWSAVRLAKGLEQYLVSGQGGYNSYRLARTEIARAANQAAYISAYLNPYVGGIDLARSGSGDPNCPTCKAHATIGIGGDRVKPPYSIHSAVIPPLHPNCLCHSRATMKDNPVDVTYRLRAVMQDARANSFPPAVTPANADAFTNMLLHRALGNLVAQFKGQLSLLGF